MTRAQDIGGLLYRLVRQDAAVHRGARGLRQRVLHLPASSSVATQVVRICAL